VCQPYQNTIKFPHYSSHGCTPLDAVATQLLYIVECVVVCKLKLILCVCARTRACMLGLVLQSQAEIFSTSMSVFMYTVLIVSPETVVSLKSSVHVLHLLMFSAIYFDTLAFMFSLRKEDTPCKLVFSLYSSQY